MKFLGAHKAPRGLFFLAVHIHPAGKLLLLLNRARHHQAALVSIPHELPIAIGLWVQTSVVVNIL